MKNLNLNTKLNNLTKRHMKAYQSDIELDKEYIKKHGLNTYYLSMRKSGTVLSTKDEYESDRKVKGIFEWYKENLTTFLYIINVTDFINGEPFGTCKKVKAFA